MSRSWLFRNATVVSVDDKIGTVPNCDVYVEDGVIKEVGPNLQLPSNKNDIEVVDATNAILSPGFVDTHRHMWQTQLRTITGDFTLTDYVVNIRNRYGSTYTPDDVFLGNLCGALESLESGITCVLDHSHIMNSPEHSQAAVDGLKASRIRGCFCYGLYVNPATSDPAAINKGTQRAEQTPDEEKAEGKWRYNDAAHLRKTAFSPGNAPTDLLRFGFAPTEAERVPLQQSVDELQFGRSLGAALITAHVAMGTYDTGSHIVRGLAERNLLGPDLVFSHATCLAPDEIDAIRTAGASISSTPDTELQMGMGRPVALQLAKDPKVHGHGCCTSLGVDIVSNSPGDMFVQMRLLLQSQRYATDGNLPPAPTKMSVTCADVLRIATLGGATAMGIAEVTGSITPGKRADLLMTRCDSLRMTPVHQPEVALVLYANASDIDSVFVDGVRVKKDGKILPASGRPELAWPVLRDRLRASAAGIMERSSLIPLDESDSSVHAYYKLGKVSK